MTTSTLFGPLPSKHLWETCILQWLKNVDGKEEWGTKLSPDVRLPQPKLSVTAKLRGMVSSGASQAPGVNKPTAAFPPGMAALESDHCWSVC